MPPASRASLCQATLKELRAHPCYRALPSGRVFGGRTKSQLSAEELCLWFLYNECWFPHVAGKVPSPVKVSTQCHNTGDPVTLEEYTDADAKAAFPDDVITILLPGQSKGECMIRRGLINYWKAYATEDVVFEWRGPNRGSLDDTKPLAKLPITGVWITKRAALAMITSKRRVFRLQSLGKKYMGTKVHYISSVWGQHNEVYDLA